MAIPAIIPFLSASDCPPDLNDAVFQLIQEDAALNASIPEGMRAPLRKLLRYVNSYYSNKIEGNSTHPSDILNSTDSGSRTKGVTEILSHAEAQASLAAMDIGPDKVTSKEFLSRVHEEFYKPLPAEFRLIDDPDGNKVELIPGKFRERNVKVGNHVPPDHSDLSNYLDWFSRAYSLDRVHGTEKILAAAAAHHRLMWIHPFMDGNGRVGRLFTDNYLRYAGLGGYNLWSISRGFARTSDDYYRFLSIADSERQGNADGRGLLSDKGLIKFMEYFVNTALDQVLYFKGIFESKKIESRIDMYFQYRDQGMTTPDGKPLSKLPPEVKHVYKKLLFNGPMTRSEIQSFLGVGEKKVRTIIEKMSATNLVDASPRMNVTLRMPYDVSEIVFPFLWTTQGK